MAKEMGRKRASDLRKQAEKILSAKPAAFHALASADVQKLIHELNVHQIELEMQNDELRRIQLDLQETRDKYLDLYDLAPTGYFTLDRNSLIVDVNLAGSELLGSEKNRLIGTQFSASISPDSQDAYYFHYREVLKTGIKDNCELKMLKADGTPFHAQLISMAVLEKDGKINHCKTAIIDITERKEAEEERRRFEEKAQIANRLAAVGEMSAGIAHEINNPLTSVLGFSKLLLEKENVPEELKDDLKLIADGGQRVADIIRRLLTFARQTKPIKTSVNLNELIDNTLKLRDYVLKTANIEVVTRFDPELPWSVADPGQFQQVFLNLIVNAEQSMKETHGKGTLTIATEKKGNSILISFQDDGHGIAKENMGRLFQPFFTTKAPGEGTGLGLSLSRSIVLEHGGGINVESEPGHGATFIIELPITEVLSPGADASSPIAQVKPAVTKKGKILVVDDELGVRVLIEKALTRIGHSVDATANAREAADKLSVGITYDVILTDIRMPGMSGMELYAHILEKAPAMANRIIFITGDTMGTDIKAFLTQNNLLYLAKPFDIEVLKEKVGIILGAGQSENDSPDESIR